MDLKEVEWWIIDWIDMAYVRTGDGSFFQCSNEPTGSKKF